MAGDPLKKVQSGEPLHIPAAAYNAFIDAARLVRAQQSPGADVQSFARQTTLAKVKNTTGAALARFSVLALDSPIVLPASNEEEFLRQTTFVGVTPTAGDEGRFAVLLEPLANGKIGWAAVGGVVPVKLAVEGASLYDHAEISPGTCTELANVADGSAQVLWVEPTGGAVRWAVVRLSAAGGGGGGATIRIVLIDADIDGITEADPQDILTDSDVELGEDEEGWSIVFQDPPDDDYGENHVDDLNLLRYRRVKVALKYYKTTDITGTAQTGSTSTTLKLASGASSDNDFYNGDTITITGGTGSGQTKTISDYVGSTRVATVDSAWSTTPDNTSQYTITSSRNSALAYDVIDDSANDRKVVRYATTDVWYDDGKPFLGGGSRRSSDHTCQAAYRAESPSDAGDACERTCASLGQATRRAS
jgi:hypothetical protein